MPTPEHGGVARRGRPDDREGRSARRAVEEGGGGAFSVAKHVRPTDPALKPHRRGKSYGKEVRDLRPKHAIGRAGRVVIDMQIDRTRTRTRA